MAARGEIPGAAKFGRWTFDERALRNLIRVLARERESYTCSALPIVTASRLPKFTVPLLIAVAATAFLNFASFVIIAVHLGGDALNGKVENGRYFLSNHGRLTEVSADVFSYSRWHAESVFVTHALGMCAMAGLFVIGRRRFMHRSR